MSTTSDIVRRALRHVGELPKGKVPAAYDLEDGLEALQSLILGLPGLLKNARFREVAVTGPYTACEGDRCTVTTPGVVTLPTTIFDACTAKSRPPMDLARVQILGAATNAGLWVYSATLGAWNNVLGLSSDSDMPFGPEDDAGLAAILAVNLAGDYGAENELPQRVQAIAVTATRSFRSRFKRSEPHDPHRPHDGFITDRWAPFY